jgi:hypothetical protein
MDWIERCLGLAPDAGNGMAEMAIVVAAMLVLAIAAASCSARLSRWRQF